MSKSVWEANQEEKAKWGTLENTFADFPVGTPVKVICKAQDFCFFFGETGKVIRNNGKYLGIIVKFDEPRRYESGHVQETFNFAPSDLYPLTSNLEENLFDI